MNPVLSVWLDLCRVLAALFVFLGHAVGLEVAPSIMSKVWHRSADDAVTVFFVISGLVIAHATARSHVTWRDYALARMSRVYSVALVAVVFAYVVDKVGMQIRVEEYAPEWQYPRPWLFMPFHWAFLGETWVGSIQPFSAAPYWSLSYEVWYYVLFGCLTYARGWAKWPLVAVVCAIMGPRIWLLMPIWWLGVGLYRFLPRWDASAWAGRTMMAVALVAYGIFMASGARDRMDAASQDWYGWFSTFLPRPFERGATVHALSDYVVALMFALFVLGCARCELGLGSRWDRLVKWLASYTFTFYLVHFTLLTFCLALGQRSVGWGAFAVIFVVIVLVSWGMAQVGEQRRNLYRRLFDALLPGRRQG